MRTTCATRMAKRASAPRTRPTAASRSSPATCRAPATRTAGIHFSFLFLFVALFQVEKTKQNIWNGGTSLFKQQQQHEQQLIIVHVVFFYSTLSSPFKHFEKDFLKQKLKQYGRTEDEISQVCDQSDQSDHNANKQMCPQWFMLYCLLFELCEHICS